MNEYKIVGDVVEIYAQSPKHGEKTIYADLEDFDKLQEFNWHIVKSKRTFYACRNRLRSDNGVPSVLRMHQVIINHAKGGIIDHINHNGLDNRKSNLRLANPSQSGANTRLQKNNTTGFKGVHYIPRKKLYGVILICNGKRIEGGKFKNLLLAANKYNELAKIHFGDFAYLNDFTEDELKEIQNPPLEKMRKRTDNKSGYNGICFNPLQKKSPYVAYIYVRGEKKYLGSFSDVKDAVFARNKAAIKNNIPEAIIDIQ